MVRIVKKGIIGVVLFLVLMVSGVTGLRTYAYEVGQLIPEDDYLTFTSEQDNSSVAIRYSSADSLQYNKGSGWDYYTSGMIIVLNQGEKVSFCGTNVRFDSRNHVNITGKVAASGDVCSLRLDFHGKFAGLSFDCFKNMFYKCSGLTKAPKLSAVELADSCYEQMFYNCTSLTEPPALPATTLAESCYYDMFFGCTSLKKAPELPATTLADYCYTEMFYGCTSLKKAPELPATDLAKSCYEKMFSRCTSLTEPPALPATTLSAYCYNLMFFNCESIKLSKEKGTYYNAEYKIPSSGIGTTADGALDDMFSGTRGTFTGTPEINTVYYIYKPFFLSETSLTIEKGEVKKLTATIDTYIQDRKVKWEAICENDEIGLYSDQDCTKEITSDETIYLTVYVKGKNISSENVTVRVTVKDSGNNAYSSECSIGVSLVAPTFTVTIPATIVFDGTGTATASMEIKFNDLYSENFNKAVFKNKSIFVTLEKVNTDAINSGTGYYLLNQTAPGTSSDDHTPDAEFTMSVINTDNEPFDPRATWSKNASGTETTSALLKAFAYDGSNYYCEDSASIEFHLLNTDKLPVGEYKGTLTFKVSTKDYDAQDFVTRMNQDPSPVKSIPHYNDTQ